MIASIVRCSLCYILFAFTGLFIIFVTAAPGFSAEPPDFQMTVRYDDLKRVPENTHDYILSVARHESNGPIGLRFTSATFPFSGILLRGGQYVCSGSLVGSNLFLTAAHCLCHGGENGKAYSDTTSCLKDNIPASVDNAVYFPASTTYIKIEAQDIYINPQFHQLSLIPPLQGPIADLALLRLETPPPILPATPSAAKLDPFGVLGFGKVAIVSSLAETEPPPVPPGRYDGIPTYAFASKPYPCPRQFVDVMCAYFYGIESTGIGNQLPCDGDSGGAVLGWDGTGSFPLIGVTSSVAENTTCDGESNGGSGIGFYTKIEPYIGWINKYLSESTQPPPDICGEGFFRIKDDNKIGTVILTHLPINAVVSLIQSYHDYDGKEPIATIPAGCSRIGTKDDSEDHFSCVDTKAELSLSVNGAGSFLAVICSPPGR